MLTFRPDAHAVLTFRSEACGQRAVAVEVLVERTALNRDVAVRRECTGQYCHVAEGGLGRLVENVCESEVSGLAPKYVRAFTKSLTRHLVFKILRRDERAAQSESGRPSVPAEPVAEKKRWRTYLKSFRPPFPSMACK